MKNIIKRNIERNENMWRNCAHIIIRNKYFVRIIVDAVCAFSNPLSRSYFNEFNKNTVL